MSRANTAARLRLLADGKDDTAVPKRLPKDVPNPYYVGQREVLNYFAVVELWAKAAKLRATGSL